jgi:protein-tyrosine-phosphatase
MSKATDHPKGEGSEPVISSVLFVCGMNAIRSPIAECLLKSIRGDRIYCDSAGVNAGDLDPFAVSVMAERKLSLEKHKPKKLEDLDDYYFDLIITLSPEAHHHVLSLISGEHLEVEYWPTMDPSTIAGSRESVLEGYRQIRDTLERKILQKFAK